jgi:hypothetical protein
MSGTSALSNIERSRVEEIVRHSLAESGREWGRPEFSDLADDANIFEAIDSFAVVELLLQTESDLEAAIGRYVPLADEQVLDADKSPLRALNRWIDHVAASANG